MKLSGLLAGGVSLLASALLVACGSGGSNSAAAGGDDTLLSRQQAAPLVLYANDFVDDLPIMFEAATGYRMEGVHFSGGPLLARIEAEQANPQWDVVLVDGHGSIRNFGDRDFLRTDWQPEIFDNLSEFARSQVPDDYAFFPIGIHAAGLIAYNKNLVSESEAPKTWEEFFAFDGPAGHADPAVAAPGYPLVSAFFEKWGIDETKRIYEQRFRDGFSVYPRNPAVLEALLSGEIHVAALQEHNSYGAQMEDEPVGVIWPDEGAPGSLRVVAINKRSRNLEAAKAFVEFLLRPETQNALVSLPGQDGFFTPMSRNTRIREERRQDGTFLLPPAAWSAEHEADIKNWFADMAAR